MGDVNVLFVCRIVGENVSCICARGVTSMLGVGFAHRKQIMWLPLVLVGFMCM